VGTAGQREGERVHAREPASTVLAHGAARERGEGEESASAQGCADRWDPPVRQRARAGAGLSGLPWAELAFPFSWNF
jgi:hypothetical protein